MEKVFVTRVDQPAPQMVSQNDANSDVAPVWLDSQTLAHITREPRGVFNVAWFRLGGGRSLVTEEGSVRGRPSFHSKLGLLVFERTYEKKDTDFSSQEICSIEISTGEYSKITTNDEEDFAPAISPDGTKIAFSRRTGGNYDVYVMNLDGSGERRLTTDVGSDQYPTWSPDSRQIAFESTRSGSKCIHIMDADGSNVRKLTQGPMDSVPAWSPNGKYMAYCSGSLPNTQILVTPVKRPLP